MFERQRTGALSNALSALVYGRICHPIYPVFLRYRTDCAQCLNGRCFSLPEESRCCLRRLWLRALAKLRNGWSKQASCTREDSLSRWRSCSFARWAPLECPRPPIPSPYGLIVKLNLQGYRSAPRIVSFGLQLYGATPCTKSRRTWKYCSKLSFATASSACAWIPRSTPP